MQIKIPCDICRKYLESGFTLVNKGKVFLLCKDCYNQLKQHNLSEKEEQKVLENLNIPNLIKNNIPIKKEE